AALRSALDDEFDPDPSQAPDAEALDAERIAAQARRGHELLLGLVGGTSAVVVASAAVLGFSDNVWGRLLALAAGVSVLIRARLSRSTSQVTCALGAGIGSVAALLLGLVLTRPAEALTEFVLHGDRGALDLRTIWLSAAVTAGAALITAIGLIVP